MSLGYLADPLGRERTLSIACAVFTVGAILQAASYTIVQIVCLSTSAISHSTKPI
jgi:MFS family permease